MFTCRKEFMENRLSKIIDQVCILSRHKFTLFKTTDFQVFWYILLYSAYSDISSILIAVFFWVFFQFQNKHSGRTDCRVSFFAGFLEPFYWKKIISGRSLLFHFSLVRRLILYCYNFIFQHHHCKGVCLLQTVHRWDFAGKVIWNCL